MVGKNNSKRNLEEHSIAVISRSIMDQQNPQSLNLYDIPLKLMYFEWYDSVSYANSDQFSFFTKTIKSTSNESH